MAVEQKRASGKPLMRVAAINESIGYLADHRPPRAILFGKVFFVHSLAFIEAVFEKGLIQAHPDYPIDFYLSGSVNGSWVDKAFVCLQEGVKKNLLSPVED